MLPDGITFNFLKFVDEARYYQGVCQLLVLIFQTSSLPNQLKFVALDQLERFLHSLRTAQVVIRLLHLLLALVPRIVDISRPVPCSAGFLHGLYTPCSSNCTAVMLAQAYPYSLQIVWVDCR